MQLLITRLNLALVVLRSLKQIFNTAPFGICATTAAVTVGVGSIVKWRFHSHRCELVFLVSTRLIRSSSLGLAQTNSLLNKSPVSTLPTACNGLIGSQGIDLCSRITKFAPLRCKPNPTVHMLRSAIHNSPAFTVLITTGIQRAFLSMTILTSKHVNCQS